MEPEVHGLVALMEIQASRSRARVGPSGELIRLLDQNRALWDHLLIRRGLAALQRAEALGGARGPYSLQAAIAACHARAPAPADTDWARIAALYQELAQRHPITRRRAEPRGGGRHGLRSASGPRAGRRPDLGALAPELPPPAERAGRLPGQARPARRGPRGVRARRPRSRATPASASCSSIAHELCRRINLDGADIGLCDRESRDRRTDRHRRSYRLVARVEARNHRAHSSNQGQVSMKTQSRTQIILLFGPSGAGKSTLARLLAGRLPRCACIEVDTLRYMIVGGLVAGSGGTPPSQAPVEYRASVGWEWRMPSGWRKGLPPRASPVSSRAWRTTAAPVRAGLNELSPGTRSVAWPWCVQKRCCQNVGVSEDGTTIYPRR